MEKEKNKKFDITKVALLTAATLVTVVLGIFIYYQVYLKPYDVRISNVTSTGATVTWKTKGKTATSIKYGKEGNEMKKIQKDDRGVEKSKTHMVTIVNLDPETKYEFKVGNGMKYKGGDKVMAERFTQNETTEIKTYKIMEDPLVPAGVYGKVDCADRCNEYVVYMKPEGHTPVVSYPNESGGWEIDFSGSRGENGEATQFQGEIVVDVLVENGEGKYVKDGQKVKIGEKLENKINF